MHTSRFTATYHPKKLWAKVLILCNVKVVVISNYISLLCMYSYSCLIGGLEHQDVYVTLPSTSEGLYLYIIGRNVFVFAINIFCHVLEIPGSNNRGVGGLSEGGGCSYGSSSP